MPSPATKKAARLTFHTLAAIFGSLSIIFAVAAWRLSSGPVSIGFLEPYLERAFSDEKLAYRVEFEDTILTWAGWERSLDILALDVRVLAPDGTLIAEAPKVSLELSGTSLLTGTVAPTSIELIGPDIRFARSAAGDISFGVGHAPLPPGPVDGADSGVGSQDSAAFSALISDMLSDPGEDHPLAKLRRIALLDGDLKMDDKRLGLDWRAPETDLIFDIGEDGISGDVHLDVDLAGVGGTISATTFFSHADELLRATVYFSDVVPAQLAKLSPQLAELAAIDAPVAGRLEVVSDRQGHFVDRVGFEFDGGPGVFDAPDFAPTARPFDYFKAVGDVDPSFSLLRLDDLFVDAGGPTFTFIGVLEKAEAGIGVNGEATIVDMPFDDLEGYWPEILLPPTRNWVLKNVSAGMMDRFAATIDLEPGEFPINIEKPIRREAVLAEFEYTDITVDYLHPMPVVTGVDGVGRADTQTMFLDMWGGQVGDIVASRGQASMWNLTGAEEPFIAMTVQGQASAADALSLIDADPLRMAEKMNVIPEQIRGRVDVHLGVQFPLDTSIGVEDVDVTAIAQLRDIAGEALMIDGYDLANGNLELRFTNQEMRVEGDADINGVPSSIVWHENFRDGAEYSRRYDVAAVFDVASQQRLGMDFAPYAVGPMHLELVVTENGPEERRAALVIDARETELALPELHWRKPSGEGAVLQLLMDAPAGEPIDILSAELQAGALHAEGRARLTATSDGSFAVEEAELTRLLYGDNDFGATLRHGDGGALSISLYGESLDLRPYLDELFDQGTEAMPPFVLDFDVRRLITRADQQITDARAHVVNTAERLDSAYLEGAFPSGRTMRVVLEPDGPTRRLRVISDDAGSLARAFDIYDNALGGELFMEAVLHDDEEPFRVSGDVNVSDYRVINAPVLAQLLNIASLTGILESLQGDGIAFSTFVFPFDMRGDEVVITGARARGTSLGVHAEGTLDLAGEVANIHGTIAPAYAINSIISNIPIIGEVLAGGEGEGLFAATYTVRGPLDEPTITVNPLAALAPGFLRNLFSVFDPDADTESDTPRPSGSDINR